MTASAAAERKSHIAELQQVQARIESAYPGLSQQLKIAARHVLDAPDEVALHSMRELAARAGVQPSTMLRLARELGFEGFRQFQEPYRQSLRGGPAHYAARARQLQLLQGESSGAGLLADLYGTAARNIEETFATIDAERLERAATDLLAARRIYVVGLRKCFPLAFYAHYATRMFRDGVTLVSGVAGTFADELAGMAAADALLAIGFHRYTRETVVAAERARTVGARVVAVTDSKVSPLAAAADHAFVVANASPSFFRSLGAAQAVIEALVAFMVARQGPGAVDALGRTERQLDEFRVYWREGGSVRSAT